MDCLKKCLTYITWHKTWKYSFDKPNQWKKDIQETWKKIWYSILYSPDSNFQLWRNEKAIQIYNTKRGTTHTVVVWFNLWHKYIAYNPNDIKDLTSKSWFITVTKF